MHAEGKSIHLPIYFAAVKHCFQNVYHKGLPIEVVESYSRLKRLAHQHQIHSDSPYMFLELQRDELQLMSWHSHPCKSMPKLACPHFPSNLASISSQSYGKQIILPYVKSWLEKPHASEVQSVSAKCVSCFYTESCHDSWREFCKPWNTCSNGSAINIFLMIQILVAMNGCVAITTYNSTRRLFNSVLRLRCLGPLALGGINCKETCVTTHTNWSTIIALIIQTF